MLENLIMKNYIAVSFALGKSKYDEEEDEETRYYKIDKNEILKDFDLLMNDDIKVLKETNFNIEVTEYNVNLFKKLRRLENLDEDKIIEMIQPKYGTNDLIQLNNDSLYICSTNKLLLLKQINKEKMINFQNNILPHLYDYFSNNPNSIICRVLGLYRIKIEQNEEIYMALTYNICKTLENNEENSNQMELSEIELKQHIKSLNKSAEFTIDKKLTENSLNVKNELSSEANGIENKDSFSVFLEDKANEDLDTIINKEDEFMKKIGINRYTFTIFEGTIINNDKSINLLENNSQKNCDKNKYDDIILDNFKKYEFKSTKINSIYSIWLNGI